MVDCLGVLKVAEQKNANDVIEMEILESINDALENPKNSITLRHINSHIGIPGNEMADFIAKAAGNDLEKPENPVKIGYIQIKSMLKNIIKKRKTKVIISLKDKSSQMYCKITRGLTKNPLTEGDKPRAIASIKARIATDSFAPATLCLFAEGIAFCKYCSQRCAKYVVFNSQHLIFDCPKTNVIYKSYCGGDSIIDSIYSENFDRFLIEAGCIRCSNRE